MLYEVITPIDEDEDQHRGREHVPTRREDREQRDVGVELPEPRDEPFQFSSYHFV